MITPQEFERHAARARECREEAARCAGALAELKGRLRKEFGLDVPAAKKEARRLKAEVERLEADYREKLAACERELSERESDERG